MILLGETKFLKWSRRAEKIDRVYRCDSKLDLQVELGAGRPGALGA